MNLRCRSDHARTLSTPKYPLITTMAVVSLAYIVFMETLIKPVNKLACKRLVLSDLHHYHIYVFELTARNKTRPFLL